MIKLYFQFEINVLVDLTTLKLSANQCYKFQVIKYFGYIVVIQ